MIPRIVMLLTTDRIKQIDAKVFSLFLSLFNFIFPSIVSSYRFTIIATEIIIIYRVNV